MLLFNIQVSDIMRIQQEHDLQFDIMTGSWGVISNRFGHVGMQKNEFKATQMVLQRDYLKYSQKYQIIAGDVPS